MCFCECQDLLSPYDEMHVCTDQTSVYSLIRKSFGGNGVRTLVNSKGKITSTRKILLRGCLNPQRCIKQDSEPNTLPTELLQPLIRVVGNRTVYLKWSFLLLSALVLNYVQVIFSKSLYIPLFFIYLFYLSCELSLDL